MKMIEELKKKRFQFMHRLYEKSGGDRMKLFFETGRTLEKSLVSQRTSVRLSINICEGKD